MLPTTTAAGSAGVHVSADEEPVIVPAVTNATGSVAVDATKNRVLNMDTYRLPLIKLDMRRLRLPVARSDPAARNVMRALDAWRAE
jgi:hypothetical protein